MNFYLFREAEKSIYEDVCPYHYQVRKGSAVTAKLNENSLKDQLKVLKILRRETQGDEPLQAVINARIVARLIGISTMSLKGQKDLVQPYRKEARQELRRMLPQILRESYSKKQKIMAAWVSVCPTSYRWVHSIYEKITGLDKKYCIE
jgi:hypothetical protein